MATNTVNTNDPSLSYFTILDKCEETDDSSYTRIRDGKEEIVSRIQLSLVVPGMQDRVRVELPLELAPSTDLLAQWELEESWLLVSASSMRALSFRRTNPRPGEKELSAFVVFAATSVREVSAEERKQLQAAEKAAQKHATSAAAADAQVSA
jgi:hypothetical protein